MYKLTKNVRSQNDVVYSKLQEDISVGLVSEETVQVLNRRVEAKWKQKTSMNGTKMVSRS